MRVAGRVAAAVAVVSFLAIGLHGRVAKVLEKTTVSVSDDGLAWIRRTACSLADGVQRHPAGSPKMTRKRIATHEIKYTLIKL